MSATVDIADELYVDPKYIDDNLELTQKTTPNPAVSPFTNTNYPTQIEQIDYSFVCEYRGTYANNQWRPKSSLFGFVRKTPTGEPKIHNGLDIYAPKKTAIIATVDGAIIFKKDDGSKLGHRAWIRFKWNNLPHRFIYGHLDSFEGVNRPVSKGEVIGYTGCTGNVEPGTCHTQNQCGLVSDHVHMALINDSTTKFVNPQTFLNWSIRYQDDQRSEDCSGVVKMQISKI